VAVPGFVNGKERLMIQSALATSQRVEMRAWAIAFARVILGLIFGMAGYWKCFVLTPSGHVQRFFLPYADTWIPVWLLWAVGSVIPVVELVAGWLLVVGYRVRESLVALGFVLVTVTYGHLLKDPLYSFSDHVIPRLALLVFVALLIDDDQFAVDYWWRRHQRSSAGARTQTH
jgi:thiosulfate dehydrogenase (quinone) large subunit